MRLKKSFSFLLPPSLALALALVVNTHGGGAQAQAPTRAQVTILSTTDLHGNILPIDYYTNK